MRAFQVDIPKRSQSCFHKEEKFAPGMEYYSLLFEDENFKIQRQDFCKACWDICSTDDKLSNSRGYWKSRIEDKHIKIPSDRPAKALKLLKELMQLPEPPLSEIYVLAILLAHFRRLILRKEFSEEKKNFHLYEVQHQDEFIRIQLINLHTNEIETIQKNLAVKLNSP